MIKNITLFILLFVSISFSNAQTNTEYCNKYKIIIKTFKANFIEPEKCKEFDKEMFFKDFINSLDPYQIIFSAEQVQQLNNVKEAVGNDYANAYCITSESLNNLYNTSLQEFLVALNSIKITAQDFNSRDSLQANRTYNLEYFNQNKQSRIKNHLKYKILYEFFESNSNPDSIIEDKALLNKELTTLADNIIRKEKNKVENLINSEAKLKEQVFTKYVNSILLQIDPHSNYFPEEDFKDFQEQLSSTSSSFGIQLEIDQQERYIISAIVPGSYAWKTGQINVGDEIVAIKAGDKETLNLEYADYEDVAIYFESSSSDKLSITIISNVGEEDVIDLYKEEVNDQQNVVQSFILNGDVKVGYILLPAFYTSWEQGNYFGCSQDVAKAVYELKKENIESLILDLRDNGGGSLKEAIELAGIFIDFGTMSIEKNQNQDLISMKDFNRGTMYSGPMAILVNQGSASASEMVAAVLQDYNRALIIGNSTFGKASGQTLFSASGEMAAMGNLADNDVLKITNSRFYRVTGQSYQKNGVIPDIELPGINIPGSYSEANYRSAFNNDSVVKKTYYKPLAKAPIAKLKNESLKRIDENPGFKGILAVNNSLDAFFADYNYIPLSLGSFQKYYSDKETVLDKISMLDEENQGNYAIEPLKSEKEMSELFEYYNDLNENIINTIKTDPYIGETYNILNDLINFSKQ